MAISGGAKPCVHVRMEGRRVIIGASHMAQSDKIEEDMQQAALRVIQGERVTIRLYGTNVRDMIAYIGEALGNGE